MARWPCLVVFSFKPTHTGNVQCRLERVKGEWGRYLETCLCVCVCLDINNVVHVPATFIATSHGGRHARWQSAPKLSATLPPPPLLRQRHLECSTQVYLRFLRPLLPMTFCLLKCKIYRCTAAAAWPRVSEEVTTPTVHYLPLAQLPTCHCPQCSLACHKNNAWLALSKQAAVAAAAASGFACFGHLQLLPP